MNNKHKNKEEQLSNVLVLFNKKMSVYGNSIIDHILLSNGIDPKLSILKSDKLPDVFFTYIQSDTLFNVINQCNNFYNDFDKTTTFNGINIKENEIYIDYQPFLLKQFENANIETYDSFSGAVDAYYSHFDSSKIDKELVNTQTKITQKVEKIKNDQSSRIEELHTKILDSNAKAILIENNIELVDFTINTIRSYIAQSYQWDAIDRIIQKEKELGNPVAKCIQSLHLDCNCFTIQLCTYDNEIGLVDIDITQNAYKNAEMYYIKEKEDKAKMEKTIVASQKLQKKAEKEANKELSLLSNQKPTFHEIRKAMWFEKFHWFISSENYLVICGRDAIQNELIVKKYMKAYDIFVFIIIIIQIHSDVHGSSSTLIINNNKQYCIPKQTIQEAGAFCICHSAAWKNNIVCDAYWVYPYQVSKTAPTGQYIVTGSFIIRGKKNYISSLSLEMGYSLLFQVDNDSVSRHLHDRIVKAALERIFFLYFLAIPAEVIKNASKSQTVDEVESVKENENSIKPEDKKEEELKNSPPPPPSDKVPSLDIPNTETEEEETEEDTPTPGIFSKLQNILCKNSKCESEEETLIDMGGKPGKKKVFIKLYIEYKKIKKTKERRKERAK